MEGQAAADIICSPKLALKGSCVFLITRFYWAKGDCSNLGAKLFQSVHLLHLQPGRGGMGGYLVKEDLGFFPVSRVAGKMGLKRNSKLKGKSSNTSLHDKDFLWTPALCKGHFPKSTKDDSRFCAGCDVYESNMKDKGVSKSMVKYTEIICHWTTIQPDGN